MSVITKLDFVAVPSTDWKRSRAFYVDTLGLRPDEAGRRRSSGWATRVSGSGSRRRSAWSSRRRGTRTSRSTSTTSRPRAPQLEAKGVEFPGETFDTGVCHMAFFQDPDGNDLMLHHRYLPRGGGGDRVITVERTDFISVPVTDLERSIEFYEETLGLPRVAGNESWPEFQLGENVSLYLIDPTNIGQRVHGAAHGLRRPSRRRRRGGPRRPRGEGRGVRGRDVRHRRVPHGSLPRPRRQLAHAPPEVRAA